MAALDNVSRAQFSYDRSTMGQVTAHGPGVDETVYENLAGYGLRPASLRHPADVPTPLYHGTKREFAPDEQIEPGHPGNFVKRMSHIYMTEDQDEARRTYAGPSGHVYQVQPTGWYGHRRDARGSSWASGSPARIVDEVK